VNQSTDVDAIVLTKKILQGAVSRARRTDVGKAISFIEANKYHGRVKEFLKIPEDILKQRLREDDAERAKHHDILSRMISSSDPYTQQQLSYENIIHQCATFLLVGHDTTASMITWALYHIISDAEVERKVLEEVR
jgi:cytochrome P450